ncbi:TonB-linked SusC/RagA family outer membrane protein [Parabacteroides sp. PFB2-12]|uniref:SusC/RagA family TonB-linked outer membrane protein n=1 Tax=unclassified Parabacteroides TaxID=2649774 RepID=UPI002474DF29|nr:MULTISPECIES: TonB-dependent receptor [unclassified Parabacteroides]MDH6344064.1 TonB-linked SusC/RagA family outer membrane protein [Parabacteroides sp. PM6-13]MDH6391821.1 TonB-linked SusC/RagA family outer membrane protein [Parabacteroides sp. PFB2-12]
MMKKLTYLLLCLVMGIGITNAQTSSVTGTVTSAEDGEPVIGATVQVKGTNTGTITDSDGKFSIVASTGATLVISYLGMETAELPARNNMKVVLNTASQLLDAVVVVGYGSEKKVGTVVGSVAVVDKAVIENKPTANVFDALQGKVAGMQVFTSSGEPSQVSTIKIRGVGSLEASTAPLYIMDGAPVTSSAVMAMNASDFESISVLKDASATSIYGARAANGVIVITTKKGVRGKDIKPTITLRGQYTSSSMANTEFFDSLMSTSELLAFWRKSGLQSEATADRIESTYGHNNTNWRKYYYKDSAPTYETSLSISGGNERLNYFTSVGLFSSEGLAARSKYDRYTVRANMSGRLTDWLTFGMNLGGGFDESESSPYGTNSTNRGIAVLAQPFYTPYDENGEEYYGLIPGWNRYSTTYLTDKNPYDNNRITLNGNAFLELNPIENLKIRTQLATDVYDRRVTQKRLPSYAGAPNNGYIQEDFYRATTFTFTNTAEYKWKINSLHNFSVLGGHEWIGYYYSRFYGYGEGLQDDRLTLLSHTTAAQEVSSTKTEYAYLSFFGRAEYNYNNRYFLDFSLRNDQTSRFPKDNRSGMFWSVGAMWKMKEEAFMDGVDFLSHLDIKGSYGTQGISDIGDNYAYYSLLGTSYENYYANASFNADYMKSSGWAISKVGNPYMGWEKQALFTVAVDAGLFDERLKVEVEFYNKNNSDVLVAVPYPYTSGVSEVMKNTAKLNNKGIEVSIDADVVKTSDFNFSPYFRIGYNKQEITQLFPEATNDGQYWYMPNYGVYWSVGNPVSFAYPIWAGVNSETGQPQWYLAGEDPTVPTKDPNRVSTSMSDATIQNTGKKYYAPVQGSIGFNVGYKGLSLQADFTYQLGKYLINNDKYFFENPQSFNGFNQSRVVNDFWQQPGDQTRFPSTQYQFTQFDSRLIEDASFMRLKNLTLAYDLPKSLLNKTGIIRGARIYGVARNLFTITNYTGPDPEVDNNLTLGVNPNTKQFSIGVELTF